MNKRAHSTPGVRVVLTLGRVVQQHVQNAGLSHLSAPERETHRVQQILGKGGYACVGVYVCVCMY